MSIGFEKVYAMQTDLNKDHECNHSYLCIPSWS